jgi:hypothetical protein
MLALLASGAFAAVAAASPQQAFDDAVDAHYVAISDKAVCASGCQQTVIAEKSLGATGAIELRKATADYGDVYAVVFGKDGAWFAADPLDDVEEDDCGMGKCVSDRITSVSMMRRGDVAWVTLRIATTVTRTETGRAGGPARHQIVIGCKLGPAPTCLQVNAGSHWDDGHAVILRDAIHVVDDQGTRDVPVAL